MSNKQFENVEVFLGPELGTITYKVSHEKLDEILYSAYPNFDCLSKEDKSRARNTVWRYVYKIAKRKAKFRYERGSNRFSYRPYVQVIQFEDKHAKACY